MTIDVHNEIMAQFKKSLGKRDFYDKRQLEKRAAKSLGGKHHGFDTSKFTASSLFYLPVQAASGPEASFFMEFTGGNRRPINPYRWVDKTIINRQPEPEVLPVTAPARHPNIIVKNTVSTRASFAFDAAEEQASHRQVRQHRIEAAISTWQQHPKGTGNQAFFQLATSLAGAGMGRFEIEQTLQAQAAHAHGSDSQRDRRSAIPAILRTL